MAGSGRERSCQGMDVPRVVRSGLSQGACSAGRTGGGVVYFFHIFPYALGNGGLRRHSPVGIILHLIFTWVDGSLCK